MNVSTLNFINETEYESDPFASVPNYVINGTFPKTISVLGYYLTTITVIKLILVLAVILSNTFLVIVILRFKRLKAVRSNTYVLNISILNIIYFLCSPLFYSICHLFCAYEMASLLILQTQSTLLILYITFAFMMGLDWFLTCSKLQWMRKLINYYQYILIGIYVLFFLEWVASFIYSEIEHTARTAAFSLFYIIYALILTVLNILKRHINLRSESKKTEYSFTITNIIIYSFLPMLIFHLLSLIPSRYFNISLLFLEIIPEIIEIGHPILVVYMLGRLNKYFKMAYNKSFKRSVQDYQDDDLDTVSEDEFSRYNIDVPINMAQEEVSPT